MERAALCQRWSGEIRFVGRAGAIWRIEHLVGSIEGLGDLSGANPTKYMEGLGESRRRQG